MLTATGEKIVANIREKVLKKILYLPVRYFDNRSTGKIVSHIVNDTSILKDLISDHFPNFISGIISMLGALIILFIIDWKMTLTMLLSVPVILVIILPLGRIMAKISRELQEETGVFSGHVQQTLGEIRLVKSSNGESYQIDKGLNGIKKILNLGLKEARINSLIAPTMYLFIMVVIVVILSYGSIRVANGSMTSGSLVAFLLYLFQIVMPITWLAMFFNQLQKANGASERIIDILHQSVERGHDGQCIDIVDRKLVFDNVSFSYNKKDYVLQNISIEVSPGEVIALVGPSGSGKSTIFSLLERYYEPTKGLIYAGETPISDIKIDYWRNQLGLVSQDSPMMAGTIRENICYGLDSEHISDEDLWRVAKMAYADQFIKSYPDGMDTHVGERGIKLSGGQRQRIAIARAFLRNPSILLMDEATASLDSQSEGVVQDALFNLMQGKTTIIIAHRLSTIINADKIFFIENGQVTASGTHEDLMESHSLYRQFAEIQLVK